MSHRRTILFLTSLLAAATGTQAAETDIQARAGVSLDLNLPSRWSAGFEAQIRIVDDVSTYRGSYFTVEPAYGLTKDLTLLASYRRGVTESGDSNRYAAGFEYEKKLDKLRIAFRPMVQYRKRIEEDDPLATVDDDEIGGDGDTFVRTRLRLKYAASKRLDVYASVEPYFVFGEDYPIDNWRNTLGVRYEFSRNALVDLYYIIRPDYGKSYNRLFHVVGINLRFKAKVRGN